MDKSSARRLQTINQIYKALIRLISKNDFKQISIKMISKEAGVARGTFYHYFVDKYSLLDQLENILIDRVIQIFDEDPQKTTISFSNSPHSGAFYKMLEYLYQERETILILFDCDQSVLVQKIHNLIVKNILGDSCFEPVHTPAEHDVISYALAQELLAQNILSILKFWLTQPDVASPEIACTIFLKSRTLSPIDLANIFNINLNVESTKIE